MYSLRSEMPLISNESTSRPWLCRASFATSRTATVSWSRLRMIVETSVAPIEARSEPDRTSRAKSSIFFS